MYLVDEKLLMSTDRGVSAETGGLCGPDDQTHRDVGHHGPAPQNAHLHRTAAAAAGRALREWLG